MKKAIGILFLFSASHWSSAADSFSVVEQFVEAFNQQNVARMLELAKPEIQWMSLAGQNLSVQTSGHTELRESMTAYFESTPSARSNILSISSSGPFIHTLEQAVWSSAGIERTQCSVAVYEIQADKILYVWYFPEHSCP